MREISSLQLKNRETAAELVGILIKRRLTLSTAESCTGGLISKYITDIPGASEVFYGGVVSYDNSVKKSLLGVGGDTLLNFGAVSERTACEMALGARKAVGTDVSVSVTGIAGPGGAVPGKPVGTVYIGVAYGNGADSSLHSFSGSREEIREMSAGAALEELVRILS